MCFKYIWSIILIINVNSFPTYSNNNEVENNEIYQENYNKLVSTFLRDYYKMKNDKTDQENFNNLLSEITSSDYNVANNEIDQEKLIAVIKSPKMESDEENSNIKLLSEINNSDYASSKSNYNTKCGIRKNQYLSPRILNGEESETNEFPWQITLILKTIDYNKNEELIFNGGGSLIHPSVVMTVAHRVNNITPNKLRIRAGQWNILSNDEINQRQDRNISKIIIHENYKSITFENNIALLILEKPLILTTFVNPICLPPPNINYDNNLCKVSGWGKNQFGINGQYQQILNKIDLSIVSHKYCKRAYRNIGIRNLNLTSFICAGGEDNKDTCTGDGGSPLVCPISSNSEQYYQIGIVSAGSGCGRIGIPGLYTNIPYMRNWIDGKMYQQGFDISSYLYIN